MKRRTFLQLMLGTASGATIHGSLAFLWPPDQKDRPVSEPMVIHIDEDGYLYDSQYEDELPTRRDYYDIDSMPPKKRLDFYRDHFGELSLQYYLRDVEEHAVPMKVSIERLDSCLESYFDSYIDTEEWSFREQMENSAYWIGAWLYDNLPNERIQQLRLGYIDGEYPGSSFSAVRYRGNLDLINTVLLSCGLNATCLRDTT